MSFGRTLCGLQSCQVVICSVWRAMACCIFVEVHINLAYSVLQIKLDVAHPALPMHTQNLFSSMPVLEMHDSRHSIAKNPGYVPGYNFHLRLYSLTKDSSQLCAPESQSVISLICFQQTSSGNLRL